jgi:hypothetical protein
MAAHCLIFASLNVLMSTVAFILLMLHIFVTTDVLHCMTLCLQMAAHCLIFASLNVLVSTVAFIC